jgi:hypothetical protein
MKNVFVLILLALMLSFPKINYATYFAGGEISWECIPAGQTDAGKYIFTIKFYRECYITNGTQSSTFGSTQTIQSNSPAGNISLTRLAGYPIDISPQCNANSSFSHITCNGMPNGEANMGAVEILVYQSQPIQISGVPPASGWEFYYASYPRIPVTNIPNASGYYLHAVMYPNQGSNAYPCFDNSPIFAENATKVIQSGYPYSFGNIAIDRDGDSLVYEWTSPLAALNNPVAFGTNYSAQSPFPGPNTNANNIAATLDSGTGQIDLTSHTTGAFAYSIKVSSFRDGVKIAEINRDNILLIQAGNSNNPPLIPPPFGNGSSYDTAIYAGDSIHFSLNADDFQFLPNGVAQTVSLHASGAQLGDYVAATSGVPPTHSTTSGCNTPPCAILTPAAAVNHPLLSMFGGQTQFGWQTTCDHLDTNNGKFVPKDYYFSFTAMDDYCPVPGLNSKTIRIRVMPRMQLQTPVLDSVTIDYAQMQANLYWTPVVDTFGVFRAYYIYASSTPTGSFALIDLVNSITQSHYARNLTNTDAQYYMIKTRNDYCQRSLSSPPSNIIDLNVTGFENAPVKRTFELFQNKPNPSNGNTQIEFFAAKAGNGQFQLLDMSGQVVKSFEVEAKAGTNTIELSTQNLSAGVYFYRLDFGFGQGIRRLIVME